MTGILGGLTLLSGSLLVLPMQRRRIKSEFSDKCTELRKALTEVLDSQIKKEARDAVEKIRESFGPFFDYVGRTTGTVDESISTVKEIKEGFVQLKRKFGMTLAEEQDAVKTGDTRVMLKNLEKNEPAANVDLPEGGEFSSEPEPEPERQPDPEPSDDLPD